MRRALLTSLASLLVLATPATAQDHATPVDVLDTIAVDHAGAAETARAELAGFLARPDVRDAAIRGGIDLRTARSAIAVLSDEDAARLATEARQIDATLAGGDTVVISTTAIIIGLLILIIILVA